MRLHRKLKKKSSLKIPFIDFTVQYSHLRGPIQRAVKKVFETQQFIHKEEVPLLEKKIAQKISVKHALGVASGSDALYLALVAMGIGLGDEVLTTPFTFFATAGSISRTGAKPVFVDIQADTFNLNPSLIEAKISRRAKAILPVHLFGLACDMKAIGAIAAKRSLKIVEDAAQSFGAQVGGRQTGSFGDAGCFSFFPTKNLGGAGDGGMVVTSSDDLADKIKVLRIHGSRQKYFHEVVGINSRLDEIQAAVVGVKLKYLDRWNAMRRAHAEAYNKAFQGLPIRTPKAPKGFRHTYHLYSILTEKRNALAAFLEKRGIGSGVYYPLSLHLQPCFKELGYRKGDFPAAEKVSGEILSLPLYPELSSDARRAVIKAVKDFFA